MDMVADCVTSPNRDESIAAIKAKIMQLTPRELAYAECFVDMERSEPGSDQYEAAKRRLDKMPKWVQKLTYENLAKMKVAKPTA
jgi:hypothetical protein